MEIHRRFRTQLFCKAANASHLAAALAIAFAVRSASAGTWAGGTGDWYDPTQWGSLQVPDASDTDYIQTGGTATFSTGTVSGSIFIGTAPGSTGQIIQSGGTITGTAVLGSPNNGGAGNYQLSGGSVNASVYNGTFTQTGGSSTISEIDGTFTLSNGSAAIRFANGAFTQTGGTVTGTSGGTNVGHGTYVISGGSQTHDTFYTTGFSIATLSNSASFTAVTMQMPGGYFHQIGGIVNVDTINATDGGDSFSQFMTSGAYQIDAGTFSAGTVNLTHDPNIGPYGGAYIQRGGSATISAVSIDSTSRFSYTGGTLSILSSLGVSGDLDFGNAAVTLTLGSATIPVVANFANGSIDNSANATVNILNPNSLAIITPSQVAGFASFTNEGITRVPGTLVIASGQTFNLAGDLTDPVEVEGTLSGSLINLYSTGQITSAGVMNLGAGVWKFNGNSTLSGTAQITAAGVYVGNSGTGTLNISGGTLNAPLYVGYGAGNTGTVIQSGATLTDVHVGSATGGTGTYQLNGGSVTIQGCETGSQIIQTGGTSKIVALYGNLQLSGGTASATFSYGTITQTGGTFDSTFNPMNVGYTLFNGAFDVSGGTQTHSTFSMQTGTVNISGTATFIASNLQLLGGFFTQSGGTVIAPQATLTSSTISGSFNVGSYNLTGGTFTAGSLTLTHDPSLLPYGGFIQQSGGTAILGGIALEPFGTYKYIAGSLSIAHSLSMDGGTMDFSDATMMLNLGSEAAGGVFSFSSGSFLNAENVSVHVIGSGALVIIPAGYDPGASFHSFINDGLTHYEGTPLVFEAGQNVSMANTALTISDDVTNGGTINTVNATVTFAGDYTGNSYVSDPSTNIFQKNVTVVPGGQMVGSAGDAFVMSGGTFTNHGTFNNGGTLTSADSVVNDGTFVQGGAQTWTDGTTFTNAGGSARFQTDTGSSGDLPLTVNVTGGSVTFDVTQHLAGLSIGAGSVTVTAAGSAATKAILFTKSLGLTDPSAKLDLNNNDLIVDYTGAGSPFAAIKGQVKLGVTSGNTVGITSSTAQASGGNTELAVIDNALHGLTSFDGVTLTGNQQVLGKYTYKGDANLDGKVTGDDYGFVDTHLGNSGAGVDWLSGDFNLDGKVTGDDYSFIDTNLGKGTDSPLAYGELQAGMMALHTAEFGASYTAALESLQGGGGAAPEPTSLGLLGLGAVGLLARRRNRK